MPFRHPNRAHDLDTRLGHEVRERLEEAIDFVCLDALVRTRQSTLAQFAEELEDKLKMMKTRRRELRKT